MVRIFDATDLVAGRMASIVAKMALEGERVDIINSENAVISGSKKEIFANFEQKRNRGEPFHGPFYPKRSDLILKRIIRGMLPYKKERGIKAMKRIMVYLGNPKNKNGETIKDINLNKMKIDKYVYLKDISKKLGAKQ